MTTREDQGSRYWLTDQGWAATQSSTRVHVTVDQLEEIAYDTGAEISMGAAYPTLRHDGLTYVADVVHAPVLPDPWPEFAAAAARIEAKWRAGHYASPDTNPPF